MKEALLVAWVCAGAFTSARWLIYHSQLKPPAEILRMARNLRTRWPELVGQLLAVATVFTLQFFIWPTYWLARLHDALERKGHL